MVRQRHEYDFYETSAGLTLALLEKLPLDNRLVLEPCAGAGAISNVLQAHAARHRTRCRVVISDIRDNAPHPINKDATDPRFWNYWANAHIDWVITNPPYKQAHRIVPLAYHAARHGVAMLLRLSWLEPCKNRAAFLQIAPLAQLIVFNPRPQFRTDTTSTDNTTSAWFVWDKWHRGPTQVTYCTDWQDKAEAYADEVKLINHAFGADMLVSDHSIKTVESRLTSKSTIG